jgi:exodeoxyribonuclease V gamma subunit
MDDELLPESEPFTLDHLEAYKLSMNTLTRLLAGQDPLPLCRQAQASALLPRGEIGRINCRQILTSAENILRQVREHAGVAATAIDISLPVAGIHITGRLDALYPGGRVSFRPAKHKAKDLLQLWIHHLILNLVRPRSIDPLSIHIATDAAITLAPVDDPQKELEKLIKLFQQGLSEPLHFYPESSFALASAKKESTGMNKAHARWYSGYHRGEEEDPAYMIALRGQDPMDEQFRTLAAIFHPILKVMEKKDAAA